MKKRWVLFAGESWMWVDSSGDIIMQTLAKKWYWISADREYPSLIKWWQANYNIFFSVERIRSASGKFDVWMWLWKVWLLYCLDHMPPWSLIIHTCEKRSEWPDDLQERAKKAWCELFLVPTRKILLENNFHLMFENTLIIWALAKVLWLSLDEITKWMYERYGKKASLREKNLFCLQKWYELIWDSVLPIDKISTHPWKRMFLEWNTSIALWAIHAGVRTFFAYPMSPSSSILGYMSATAQETWIVVKQVEDEITALQMNLWSMYAWARSLTATSWWWFDLMTETISLSGMTEVPCVVVIAQRPWPATWLPTWTAQWDLNIAIYAGHGEFSRIVVAVSDPESCFSCIQQAYTFAEVYQVPVIVLTEKNIAENRQTVPVFEQWTIAIQRWLIDDPKHLAKLKSTDRYKLTENWVSPRWLPTSSEVVYFCNWDEHKEDGTLDESPETSLMIQKRLKKMNVILDALPEPVSYWEWTYSDICFIWRWSTKNVMLDLIQDLKKVWISFTYMHYEWIYPLKKELLNDIYTTYETIVVIENNATGQLADLIQKETWQTKHERLLKWNWRQLTVEEVKTYISTLRKR